MKSFVVFKSLPGPAAWEEVACCDADDAGGAFRQIVLRPGEQLRPDVHGEYRVLSLDEGAHLAVEMQLRDLDAPTNPVEAKS